MWRRPTNGLDSDSVSLKDRTGGWDYFVGKRDPSLSELTLCTGRSTDNTLNVNDVMELAPSLLLYVRHIPKSSRLGLRLRKLRSTATMR